MFVGNANSLSLFQVLMLDFSRDIHRSFVMRCAVLNGGARQATLLAHRQVTVKQVRVRSAFLGSELNSHDGRLASSNRRQ